FQVSLLSIPLAEPAALQIVLTDIALALFFIGALERGERMRLDAVGWLLLLLIGWGGIATIAGSAHVPRSLMFLLWQLKCLGLYVLVLNMQLTEKLSTQIKTAIMIVVAIQ